MKALNKQNKIIFIMDKISGSCHDLRNIKKIKSKEPKKCSYCIINISSSDSDSDSSLYSDSE